jgi:hypothetical protein
MICHHGHERIPNPRRPCNTRHASIHPMILLTAPSPALPISQHLRRRADTDYRRVSLFWHLNNLVLHTLVVPA